MCTARVPRLLPVLVVCAALALAGAASAQEPKAAPGKAESPVFKLVGPVYDRIAIFFWEDGIDPNTGQPAPPPSFALAPITEQRTFEVETGSVVVKGGTLTEVLQIDVYLRQRYFWRNDGQNRCQVHSNPYIEIESPVFADFGGSVKWAILGNGMHLAANEGLAEGEMGQNSRGNFAREFLFKDELDAWLGPGAGAKFFAKDFTVRMSVSNTIRGLYHFVVGTGTTLYGR